MNIVLKLLVFVLSLLLVVSIEPLVADATKSVLNISNPSADDHLVTDLPGQPNVDFEHYAGYITVDEDNERQLFYWFYEATDNADEKPLVLWLNGGPGCSSVGYGATQEIGPFLVDTNGSCLTFNPFSWNREVNLLFVESPVGVGFSYSNTSGDYDKLGDDFTAQDAYTFVYNWFLMFPLYIFREFYIAGESYAGKYIPELAEVIIDANKDFFFIDLKGILVGNPELHDAEDWKGLVDYAWSHAVISDETHKMIVQSCDFYSNNTFDNQNCSDGVGELLDQYNEIDIYSLYTPKCLDNLQDSKSKYTLIKAGGSPNMIPRIMGSYDPCLDNFANSYYNRPDVQKALHVISDGISPRSWSTCNYSIFNGWKDSKPSVLPIYEKLIEANLRIWVYNGDTDGRVPVLSTRYSLNLLGLPITTPWRPWYYDRQVAGWFQMYEGLTYLTVKGAGHGVPTFVPKQSLALFAAFLAGESPPSHRN